MTIEEFQKIYSSNIKARRKLLGINQEQLAEKINLSEKYVSDIETGRRLGSLETLISIADALGAEPYEMLLPQGNAASYDTERTRKLMASLRDNVSATLDTLEKYLADN